MKALTLTQPWATLVAIGAKGIETRSWSTKYRGPLAIYAAKGWTEECVRLFFKEPFKSVLENAGYKLFSRLPRGAFVAVCELVSVKSVWALAYLRPSGWEWDGPDGTHYGFRLDDVEFAFGDYAVGRKVWLLHNVRPIIPALPASGALGLWNCDPVHEALLKGN